MTKSVRCLIILMSAVSLTAFAVPSDPIRRLKDSQRLATNNESMIFSIKAHGTAATSCTYTSFFTDYLIENAANTQVHRINKNSILKKQNIGYISKYEFDLLCQLVAAEAENQPYEGKMAVAGVVLNRSEYGWPFEEGIEGQYFKKVLLAALVMGAFMMPGSTYLKKTRMQ